MERTERDAQNTDNQNKDSKRGEREEGRADKDMAKGVSGERVHKRGESERQEPGRMENAQGVLRVGFELMSEGNRKQRECWPNTAHDGQAVKRREKRNARSREGASRRRDQAGWRVHKRCRVRDSCELSQ